MDYGQESWTMEKSHGLWTRRQTPFQFNQESFLEFHQQTLVLFTARQWATVILVSTGHVVSRRDLARVIDAQYLHRFFV
jgi:hypothetical protein